MLDVTFESIFKINAEIQPSSKPCDKIVLSHCEIFKDDAETYSEIDAGSICPLNKNNGLGSMNIKIEFANAEKYFYKNYYVNCATIRADQKIIYKPIGMKPVELYSKVTKNGNFAIGFKYFFNSKKEIQEIVNGNQFVIEFAIAIEKQRNTYQTMCRFVRTEKGWILKDGNTYRMNKRKHIGNFMH